MKKVYCDCVDCKGAQTDIKKVRMAEEFQTGDEPDYVNWCRNCRRQWGDMIEEEDYRKELSIDIFYSELNNGWIYDIYNNVNNRETKNMIDGGLCETTLENTIEMLCEKLKELI